MYLNGKTARFFMMVALAFSSVATARPQNNNGQTPEGAWYVKINFQGDSSCAGPTVLTRDGNVIAEPCSAFVGVGYGSWARVPNGQFAVTFIGNVYAATGEIAGTYKVRSLGSLDRSGNEFHSQFRADDFDAAGQLVGTVTGTTTAKRILVEPL